MINTTDLRAKAKVAVQNVEGHNFASLKNKMLTAVLLLSIIFSSVKIIQAQTPAIPDPGHDWPEVGNVLVSTAQGGTGLISIGASNQILGVDPTGTNLEYKTLDKAFVGLSNVEDTALSTWAGTANITTLGTIITGDWNGTSIDDAYITSATTWNAKEPALPLGAVTEYFAGDKTLKTLDTLAVPENGNLYYTQARFDSALATKSTTDLIEGANLYYTDARADARIALLKGLPAGLAELDGSGKIPTSQLPALAISDTSVVADEPAMLALTAEIGDVAVRIDLNKSFILTANDPTQALNWQELLTPTDTVLSVNGKTGVATLNSSDVGLGSVENTALSGWAGTANITTLGTILSGIWNGTNIDLAHGGTNANLTAVNGGIAWSDATGMQISAAGNAGDILTSGGAGAPVWSALPTMYEVSTVKAATVATAAKAATTVLITPLYIPAEITVNQMRLRVTTILGAAGDVGVYDSAGTLVLNGGAGSVTTPIGVKTVAPVQVGAARTLSPGQYYVAVTWNAATGVIAGAIMGAGSINRSGTITLVGGAVLPASITPASIVNGTYLYAVSLNN